MLLYRIRLAAVISCASAVVHVTASFGHAHDWWLLTALLGSAAELQLGWSAKVWHGASTRWLCAGVVLNLGIAAVWTLSRTCGLPFGPDAWHAEELGPADLTSTIDEFLACALIATAFVRVPGLGRMRIIHALEVLGLAALVVTFFVMASGAGHTT